MPAPERLSRGPAKLRRVLPHAVMLVASLLLYWAATRIEPGTGGRIGPDVWPKAIVVFMALLCAYEIAKRLLSREPPAEPVAASAEAAVVPPQRAHRMLWWGIALIAAYVTLVPWIGFFTATLVFLWVFPVAGGLWRPGTSGVIALAGTLLLAVVFMRVAYISLPLGEGPFKLISVALMKLVGVG